MADLMPSLPNPVRHGDPDVRWWILRQRRTLIQLELMHARVRSREFGRVSLYLEDLRKWETGRYELRDGQVYEDRDYVRIRRGVRSPDECWRLIEDDHAISGYYANTLRAAIRLKRLELALAPVWRPIFVRLPQRWQHRWTHWRGSSRRIERPALRVRSRFHALYRRVRPRPRDPIDDLLGW